MEPTICSEKDFTVADQIVNRVEPLKSTWSVAWLGMINLVPIGHQTLKLCGRINWEWVCYDILKSFR